VDKSPQARVGVAITANGCRGEGKAACRMRTQPWHRHSPKSDSEGGYRSIGVEVRRRLRLQYERPAFAAWADGALSMTVSTSRSSPARDDVRRPAPTTLKRRPTCRRERRGRGRSTSTVWRTGWWASCSSEKRVYRRSWLRPECSLGSSECRVVKTRRGSRACDRRTNARVQSLCSNRRNIDLGIGGINRNASLGSRRDGARHGESHGAARYPSVEGRGRCGTNTDSVGRTIGGAS
jgi:hypothetical protein